MTAKFLYRGKPGRALMGNILNIVDTGGPKKHQRLLEVKITSYENKKDKKFIGHCFLVDRLVCQVEE
jgi:hypothetical protein